MSSIGFLLSFYIFPFQFFFGLSSPKKIGSQFGATHVIEYLQAFL